MTSSLLAVRRGSQTPRVSTYPDAPHTSGPDVADLCEAAGLVLDPWQRYVLDHGLGERPDGKWSAREIACWVPRQNGKGAIIEARVLAGLFLFGERKILWSAHEYKTAQEGFLRIRELIESAPDFDRLVKRYWEGSGEQGIELTTGQRLKFIARSKGSGRGFSADLVILDESQDLTLLHMKAVLPTLAARPNPQVWYFGTPPEQPDAWVYGIRKDGEAGKDRLAYFDWGLGEVDLSEPLAKRMERYADRDLWFQANPALGVDRPSALTEEFCEDELSRLREGFAPERLGLWLPPADDGAGILDSKVWVDMLDPESKRSGDVAVALDVTPLRDHGTIGMYGLRDDELEHMQLVDYREGIGWMVARAAEIKSALDPICFVLDAKNGAAALIPQLAEVGIRVPDDPEHPKRGDLLVLGTAEVADAVGQYIDGYRQNPPRYRHIGQEPLDSAIRNVKARPIGDAGQIAWGRKLSEVDIGPVQVVTEARYGFWAWRDLVTYDYDVLDSVL